MLNVPKKANDAMHLSLLEGCDISIDKLGEVILQDTFQVCHIFAPNAEQYLKIICMLRFGIHGS